MATITFFLLTLLCLTFSTHRVVNGDTDLIQKTCKDTKYYDLCVSSLSSDPTSSNTDKKGLALIMVAVGMANATSTSSFLSSKSISSLNNANLKKLLKDCSDKYTLAGDAFQASIEDLSMEAYDYAYMHVMAAADYPVGCRNAFKRSPKVVYPVELAKREAGLKKICDVVLGMIDRLVVM